MITVETLVNAIANLGLADFCHLQTQLNKRTGLVIRPSRAYAPAPAPTAVIPPTKQYRVVATRILSPGEKIRAIKAIRDVLSELYRTDCMMGLKETKDLVDSVALGYEQTVKGWISSSDADYIRLKLAPYFLISVREEGTF